MLSVINGYFYHTESTCKLLSEIRIFYNNYVCCYMIVEMCRFRKLLLHDIAIHFGIRFTIRQGSLVERWKYC